MKMDSADKKVVKQLLSFEHRFIAKQLRFVEDADDCIEKDLLNKAIGLIDRLSRESSLKAKKMVVVLSAILWTYREESWDGLQEFLIMALSRAGFPPSSIMIDQEYSPETRQFSIPSVSLFNQFSITLHQLKHEIEIQKQVFLLTDFQKRVWDKLDEVKLLGISAPTSAGKSFIILLKAMAQILEKDGNIIYIVPTLSLVSQVSLDFNRQLKCFGISGYRVSTTYNSHDINNKRIYVLTQEKAISAFSQKETPFENVRMLVVDEIQNIERVASEDDQRAKTLYDTLIEFRFSCDPDVTVISGPRIDGLKSLGTSIFQEESTDEQKTMDSPVASFTYAVSKEGGKYYFNQYSDISDFIYQIAIDGEFVEGYGKSQYGDNFIEYLSVFIKNLGADACNIIFSPTTGQAMKTAVGLAENFETRENSPEIKELESYIKSTVHENYSLCTAISKGIAYHHGKMPTHVRNVVEYSIKNKMINNVVCTTTLMQGVNLPAQNVIIRNPYLAIKTQKGQKPKLTDYEIANLRGRAGRLLKDFIGRTFVLDEGAFEREDESLDLFPEAEKELASGYGEKFRQNEHEIIEDLNEDITPSDDNREYAFLLTYIRQTVLKYGEVALFRLNSVGINIERSQFEIIQESLANLAVSKDVCYKNRYWDPLDLNEMYLAKDDFIIPSSHSSHGIANQITTLLFKMEKHYNYYYEKYFGLNKRMIPSASISATDWMKEKSLKKILDKPYFDDPTKIDPQISIIQNKISYGLPMLLKPIYDMVLPNSMFLRFIEMGAYRPITRKMIEMNIPRETAISLCNDFFSSFSVASDEEDIEAMIVEKLTRIRSQIDYWRRVQIEGIL